jgi:hypothetical protein
MDALAAMRTIGANRVYLPDDVPDEVVYEAVESAASRPRAATASRCGWWSSATQRRSGG